MERAFFERDVCSVARALLGMRLIHETPEGVVSGMIVETEAYSGINDAACHAYPYKRTARTEVLFGEGGHAYVYRIYGLHYCFNVVANTPGQPEGVLIRALKPLNGISLMQQRRGVEDTNKLCAGPGRLCQAFAIDRRHYGQDLLAGDLRVENYETPGEIVASPRINIDYAGEARLYPWRFQTRLS